jgi:hypothetical protein
MFIEKIFFAYNKKINAKFIIFKKNNILKNNFKRKTII